MKGWCPLDNFIDWMNGKDRNEFVWPKEGTFEYSELRAKQTRQMNEIFDKERAEIQRRTDSATVTK